MKSDIIATLHQTYDALYSLSFIEAQHRDTWYFDAEEDVSRCMNIKSVSKLIVALAVGCALERGWITNLDINICDVLKQPQYPPITLRQLLTMTAGIPYQEGSDQAEWLNSHHWADAYLSKGSPIKHNPPFIYATPNVYLISVLLQEVTKKHLFDFANEVLFQPLGIQHFLCQKSPQGYDYGGSDFAIPSKDMSKIVQMVCNKGNYEGKQIVEASWIDAMLTPYVEVNPSCQYGYLSFLYHSPSCLRPYWIIPGSGGQYAFLSVEQRKGMLLIANIPNKRMNQDPLKNELCDELCQIFEAYHQSEK